MAFRHCSWFPVGCSCAKKKITLGRWLWMLADYFQSLKIVSTCPSRNLISFYQTITYRSSCYKSLDHSYIVIPGILLFHAIAKGAWFTNIAIIKKLHLQRVFPKFPNFGSSLSKLANMRSHWIRHCSWFPCIVSEIKLTRGTGNVEWCRSFSNLDQSLKHNTLMEVMLWM